MTISIEDANGRLAEVLERLADGPIILTRDELPVAQITRPDPKPEKAVGVRKLGTLKGTVLYMAPDFNDTPPGFEEYMP
jgi:antitoxin (DNA-binding transcriptional repressor) of toxin-antitoxin stability system